MNKLMMFKVTYIEASITFRFYMLYLKLINTFMPYFFFINFHGSSLLSCNSQFLNKVKKKKRMYYQDLFISKIYRQACNERYFICLFWFFFLIMDFCHSEEKLVLIFEVLNLEKLFKVFSICWFVLGVWPRQELWIYQ